MTFPLTFAVALFSLSCGSIIGNFLCIICSKIFHKRYEISRGTCIIILFCVFLISIILGLSLLTKATSPIQISKSDYLWIFLLFDIGTLSFISYRFLLPLFLLFYITGVFIVTISFYNKYGFLQKLISIQVNENVLTINNNKYSIINIKKPCVEIGVVTFPSKIILPLPRHWYYIIGVYETNRNKSLKNDRKNKTYERSTFCYLYNLFFSYLTKNSSVIYVPFKKDVLPTQYLLSLSVKNNSSYQKVKKN